MIKLLGLLISILLFGSAIQDAAAKSEPPADHGEESITDDDGLYMRLEPITATIFRKQDVAGSFTVAITLEIPRASARTKIILKRRQLRDAMFRELHAMFEREEYTGRKVDVAAIKQRMLVVSRRTVGEELVVDVFVNALMRKGA